MAQPTGPNKTRQIGIVILLLTVSLTALGGIAAAQELDVSIDVPNKATVGEEVSISASISVPDLTGSYESDMTVNLLVDGEQVDSETVTVEDGEETEVSFSTTFDSAGEHTIEIEASVELGVTSLSSSASTPIQVDEPDVATPTPDEEPDPTSTPEEESDLLTEVEGAAFAVPESVRDDVAQYREQTNIESGLEAFVLANQQDLYIVFTKQTPTKGKATVRGTALTEDLDSQDLTFGVITASQVSFETEGTSLSVSEVANNPSDHRLELIRLTATYRRVASLTDPDQGNDFTAPSTSGILIENPQTAASMFDSPGQLTRQLIQNTNTSTVESIIGSSSQPHLFTFMFETRFWTDRPTTVDGILLDPTSAAYEFVQATSQSGALRTDGGSPILYIVDEQFSPTQVEDVRSINQRSSELDGEVISVEARVLGQSISSQETIEHNTACGEDQAQVKEACVNIPQDVLLHSGVAWNQIPESEDDILFIVGASSRHQDTPVDELQGQYRIVGEVISTSRVDESLPEGSVLIIYDLERTGNLDYEDIAEEARELIENRSQLLRNHIQSQIQGTSAPSTESDTQTETNTDTTTETDTSETTDTETSQVTQQGQEDTDSVETTEEPATEKGEEEEELADNIPGSPGFTPLVALIGILVFISWQAARRSLER